MQEFSRIRISRFEGGNCKAFATVLIGELVYVTGLKIMQGSNGLFVAMPGRMTFNTGTGNKELQDVAYMVNKAARQRLQDAILAAYRGQEAASPPLGRSLALAVLAVVLVLAVPVKAGRIGRGYQPMTEHEWRLSVQAIEREANFTQDEELRAIYDDMTNLAREGYRLGLVDGLAESAAESIEDDPKP